MAFCALSEVSAFILGRLSIGASSCSEQHDAEKYHSISHACGIVETSK